MEERKGTKNEKEKLSFTNSSDYQALICQGVKHSEYKNGVAKILQVPMSGKDFK